MSAAHPAPAAERLLANTLSGAALGIADEQPPPSTRVVVIGGGIIGASVARHLAALDVETVLVERGALSSGTTWHAAGQLATVRATHALTEVARYSTDVYATLEQAAGCPTGFNRRGSVALARTAERMTELRYLAAMADHHGTDCTEVDVGAIAALHPLLDLSGVVGGMHMSGDATINPGEATLALAKLAHDGGARLVEHARVDAIETAGGRVVAVDTSRGRIECEAVALCAGLWSRALARNAGADLALYPVEHRWALSESLPHETVGLPFVRDMEGRIYVRGYRDRLLVGTFEAHGKPRDPETIADDFQFGRFEPDQERFAGALAQARQLVPALRASGIEEWLNAPEAFTPDANPLVGEAAEVDGLYVAAGLNSQGMLLGPGLGRALAEWIAGGAPGMDAAEIDARRFAPEQATSRYLRARTGETLGRVYGVHWPLQQWTTARGVRRTPLYERLAQHGACFGELAGWERANWFAGAGEAPDPAYSFGRPSWFERVRVEHRAARERVALFDLSSFGKTLVSGKDALAGVQNVFAGDLDTPVGRVVYTTMLNANGGIEADLTVTRRAESEFMVVAPTVAQHKVLHWLRRHVARPGLATVTDLTAAYGAIGVMGPQSRALLERLSDADLGNDSFPYLSAQSIDVAAARATALRVSFAGELGWELQIPADAMVHVFDELLEGGADLGVTPAGYFALDTLRIEKGYRHWGADIGPADDPLESGLGFTVGWDKDDFIGKAALAARRTQPRRARMVHLLLDDPEPLVHHGESILRDGRQVGRVTSGAYAHSLGAAAMLGFVEHDDGVTAEFLADGEFAVSIARERFPARVSLAPFYDPKGTRLRD